LAAIEKRKKNKPQDGTENNLEWFEVEETENESKPETETQVENEVQLDNKTNSDHTTAYVSFPAIVQILKNTTSQQHTLLCKAKVFYL